MITKVTQKDRLHLEMLLFIFCIKIADEYRSRLLLFVLRKKVKGIYSKFILFINPIL